MTVEATGPVPHSGHLAHAGRLDSADVADVLALATVAGDADGAYPLSEHVVLRIRHDREQPAVHLLVRDPDGSLAGYGHVDVTDAAAGPSAELLVHPVRRHRGLGRALAEAAVAAAERHDGPGGRLRLWAHGDHPSASALALSLGFDRVRVLWQMLRSPRAPVPPPQLPAGVTIRAFRPGDDDEAWVRVNARAFADHPEQGRWTLGDLRLRMAEPWFDPGGFLLAVDGGGELLGFHWTKPHGGSTGEVYVLGVDPSAGGLGLGTALTLAGLRHLRAQGRDRAMLYVDEANTAAVRLYAKLDFVRWTAHVSYARQIDSYARQADV